MNRMKTSHNLRALAAKIAFQVVEQGQSLSTILPAHQATLSGKDHALLQELSYGVLRTLSQLEWFASQLITRAITGKQRILHYLILTGFYQLLYTRIPPHAALSETVNGTVVLQRPAFKGLINGVLREFIRQKTRLQAIGAQHPSHYLYPQWLLSRLRQAFPENWQTLVHASNQHPPMWLRINSLQIQRDEWLDQWRQQGGNAFTHTQSPHALRLATPVSVYKLPGFHQGWFSVQDVNAQRCVELLAPQDGETILDLCAAPGGKTTHILQLAPGSEVMAVDVDSQRLTRVQDNLQRLGMQARVKTGDGRYPQQWCGNQQFDRVLLDVPCSATGVIRRHPDIKWLRRNEDIAGLVILQFSLLQAAWLCLKPGGTLLYATCSLLPEENHQQIARFLAVTPDAQLAAPEEQHLPEIDAGDGFFYAKLHKN